MAPAHHTALRWPRLPYWARLPLHFDAFSNSWPFGLLARGVDFYKERQYLARLGERSSSFRFSARQATPGNAAEVVIVVAVTVVATTVVVAVAAEAEMTVVAVAVADAAKPNSLAKVPTK